MKTELEPGCMAIIVGGVVRSNIGMIVKVGNFIGKIPRRNRINFVDPDMWEVDKPILFNCGRNFNLCSGKTMQRLNDEDEKDKIIEKLEITV